MKEVISLVLGILFAGAGWGWVMSKRWVILMFRTLTVECALIILLLLTYSWIKAHAQFTGFFILPFFITPLAFFWELIPFPILQFFKADNITTIRIEKKVKETSGIGYRRDMKYNPDSFIFPYLQTIKYENNYLSIRFCLFSALPYHLELSKLSVRLIINGTPTEKQPIKSITLFAQNANEKSGLQIALTEQMREKVSEYVEQHKSSVEACLDITGSDGKGEEHFLSTSERKTLFLSELES